MQNTSKTLMRHRFKTHRKHIEVIYRNHCVFNKTHDMFLSYLFSVLYKTLMCFMLNMRNVQKKTREVI